MWDALWESIVSDCIPWPHESNVYVIFDPNKEPYKFYESEKIITAIKKTMYVP